MRKGLAIALAVGLPLSLGVVCCGGAMVAAFGSALTGDAQQTATTAAFTCDGATNAPPLNTAAATSVPGWSSVQVSNAATIVQVGQQMNVPPRGWVIAVATSIQEDALRNSKVANDHDSLGLFQQRPSQGWGTPAQVTDPVYASRKFYEHLLQVPGWQQKPLTAAAQAVQRSAFPNAYAKHEPAAALLVDKVTGGAAQGAGAQAGRCAAPNEVSASGWTVPVPGQIISGFRTAARPTHYGVDLAASKHTAIHAAFAGTVIVAMCDPGTRATVGTCDRDGSSSARGCGWYVDIAHADKIITRYCHMMVAPLVKVGDQVAAGQQIGWSGSSGNSSGPHVHFEVHTNGDDHAATGAIDPVPFMRSHGAPLGSAK
jgi:murein DD-endopeptidase MepM/ murein hydrolase activator NlpD